jgi:glycosyltransferase involved in cell wall biosynthesis
MNPQISVIIPSFNTGQYITYAIDTVLNQSFKDYEIIVINDGSTDDTHKILLPYVESRKIRYYYQKNAGLSSARNAGIRRSRGNFIALLDADDAWESDKLHLQYNLINSSPHIGMVFTDFNTFSGHTILTRDKNAVKFTHHTPVPFQELFDNLNFIYPSTTLTRKAGFDECGYFDTQLKAVEDYDMWLRISKKYEIIGIQQSLTNIRLHESNMSLNVKNMLYNEISVITKYKGAVSTYVFRKRKSKIYMINADRALSCYRKGEGITYFFQGILTFPLNFYDILIVSIKLILGEKQIQRLRKKLESEGWMRNVYLFLYKRY